MTESQYVLQNLTATQIPCCVCGTMIYPNGANQCTTCLSQDFNLQDYIQRPMSSVTGNTSNSNDNKIMIYQCRSCRRFERTEKCWEHAEHESSQLMSICLKHIPALQHQNHSSSSSSSSSTSSSAMMNASNSIGPLRLIDAQWIWTEPHCMRYKIRCTIQTELHNVRVQQRVLVLIHCAFKMCQDCTREFNHRTWQSIVQLRQRVSSVAESSVSSSSSSSKATKTNKSSNQNSHTSNDQITTTKNSLSILEAALAKNKEIRKHVLKIDHVMNGYDFYFLSIPHAHTFVSFLQRITPMRVRISKKLVSTDQQSNVAHMKHTISCDMVPLCLYDLIVIHKSTSKCKLAGHLVLVTKLASVIHFIDVAPKRQRLIRNTNLKNQNNINNKNDQSSSIVDELTMELSAETYYKNEKLYRVLQSSHRLIRFVVLDVELLDDTNNTNNNNRNHYSNNNENDKTTNTGKVEQKNQYAMADVSVARESDMGSNDRIYTTITHLGHCLEPGDIVLGYDIISSSSFYMDDDDMNDNFYHNFIMPDIVLVRKVSATTTSSSTGTSNQKKSSQSSNMKQQSTIIKGKKKQRRAHDGKHTRELQDRAKRMGFIEEVVEEGDDDENNAFDEEPNEEKTTFIESDDAFGNGEETSVQQSSNSINSIDDDFIADNDDYYDDILFDTDLANEVLELEREFETLDLQNHNNDKDLASYDEADDTNYDDDKNVHGL